MSVRSIYRLMLILAITGLLVLAAVMVSAETKEPKQLQPQDCFAELRLECHYE